MRASASYILALLCLVGPGIATTAEAQTITFTVSKIGTRDITGSGVAFANATECADNVTIKASMTGPFDIWRGATGSNCQMSSNRSSTTTNVCTHVGHVTSVGANLTFELSMAALTAVTSGTSACTVTDATGQGQTFEYVVIQTSNDPDTSTSMPYGTFQLRIDAQRPVAVTVDESERFRSGGSVSLKYESAATEMEQIAYYAYVDPNGTCTEDGVPSSSVLVPGSTPPDDLDRVSASGSISPSSVGAETGSSVVVAIAPQDIAGNVGKLSPLICISFIETMGFCSAGEGGVDPECNENCAVSSPGARGPAPVLFFSALASLALVVHARRRRSAK